MLLTFTTRQRNKIRGTGFEPPDLFLHNHRQDLGRPLDPKLPVNPLCVTCLDTEAFKAMVASAEASFVARLREAEAHQKK